VQSPTAPQKPASGKKRAARQKRSKAAKAGTAAGAAATAAAAENAATPAENQTTRPAPATPAEAAVQAYAKGDYAAARRIWEKLAAAGDGLAMNNLGVLYDQGQGVEPDMGRALHWFAQAAKAGDPAGMSNYGRMLEQGRGIPASPEEAARWFDLAARKGQPVAQYNLGMLYELGRGVPKDLKAAAAWYSRAAAQQQTEALSRLGQLCRLGLGVPKNRSRATLLLYAAAMQGEPGAVRALEEMAAEEPSRPAAVLLGLRLDATDRPAVREALRRAGATPKREDDAHICDIYAAERVAPGAVQLAACYGPGDPAPLGFLELDYLAPNKKTAAQIVGMVSRRMGPPSASEGEDAHLWNLGTVVVATRYEPARRLMSLMYMAPKVYHLTRQD
jgi:TPR repeat protein